MGQLGTGSGTSGRAAAIARRQAIVSGGQRSGAVKQPTGSGRSRPPKPQPTAPQAAPSPAPAAPVKTELPRSNRPLQAAGREQASARREQQTKGKRALSGVVSHAGRPPQNSDFAGMVGRYAAKARRLQQTGGATAAVPKIEAEPAPVAPPKQQPSCSCQRSGRTDTVGTQPRRKPVQQPAQKMSRGRMLSMARRAATVARGKPGAEAMQGRSGNSTAAALLRNKGASSRDIAKQVREDRCESGKQCESSPRPTGRLRPPKPQGAPSKVGSSATASGQSVTGTLVGRSVKTTGDEFGACKSVTGTEYLGAEVFQQFCGTKAEPSRQFSIGSTTKGLPVSGDQVGRSNKVTGDETGASRELTGTPYTKPGPDGAPPKVGQTRTFSGGGVTGTRVGRSASVTGDEPGTCKQITGNEYVGAEQYEGFCATPPQPAAQNPTGNPRSFEVGTPAPFGNKKVGVDATWRGQQVTGTQTGRSSRVTGDEPGTCKAVTGTPYAGPSQVQRFCGTDATEAAAERTRSFGAMPMTGIAPGIGGKMTGDERGACEPVTGTPYVGQDQQFAECGSGADAAPGSPDFPQPLHGGNWTAFSVQTPARSAQTARETGKSGGVTGTSYAQEEGRITGPFNMGVGRVTGTENFRFQQQGSVMSPPASMNPAPPAPPTPATQPPASQAGAAEPTTAPADHDPRPRITGEGMDGGARITGDDWGRNERVTGTEGRTAAGRNPTRRGGAMAPFAGARTFQDSQAREVPQSPVTGSSGATDRGAVITLSGGARG